MRKKGENHTVSQECAECQKPLNPAYNPYVTQTFSPGILYSRCVIRCESGPHFVIKSDQKVGFPAGLCRGFKPVALLRCLF